uniref:Uncharacterized protein n=1 Tax=Trypanosoma congolense (strain IL3000) TaxID=1068625 RepID=G0UWF5_TRYCI|nr:conserved hypothetical protein [Trypanosoma congolense IL3000]
MSTSLPVGKHHSIPAVCRIRGRGTATLISPGLLLTSKHAVGSPETCASLTAVFFEGTKKKPVEVRLLPEKYYFAATYPEHMDYCLVACEQFGILNVVPVKLPLTKAGWVTVVEGEVIMVVQHPTGSDEPDNNDVEDEEPVERVKEAPGETKRFVEVLRRRDDLLYLKTRMNERTAGCPAFNDRGQLIGLQSQVCHELSGLVNHVVSISSIVRHLFANKQLWRIEHQSTFEELWGTWYIQNDISRIVSITENFKDDSIFRAAALELCEHTRKLELLGKFVEDNGIRTVLLSIDRFQDDETMLCACIRALWSVSFLEGQARTLLIEGKAADRLLLAMEKFPDNEQIAELVTLFLNNTSSGECRLSFDSDSSYRALKLVHTAQRRFKRAIVLQKFGYSFFNALMDANPSNAKILVDVGAVSHITFLVQEMMNNLYLMEIVMRFLRSVAVSQEAVDMCINKYILVRGGKGSLHLVAGMVIELMIKYKDVDSILLDGNHVLWGFGNDMSCRAAILQHPRAFEAMRLSLPVVLAKSAAS